MMIFININNWFYLFFICFQIYPGGGSRARTLPPWRISWRIGIPKFWPTTQTMNMWTISKLFFLAWKLRTSFSKLCTGQICGCLLLIEIFWSNHWQRCFPRSKLVQNIASVSWTSPGGSFNLNFICYPRCGTTFCLTKRTTYGQSHLFLFAVRWTKTSWGVCPKWVGWCHPEGFTPRLWKDTNLLFVRCGKKKWWYKMWTEQCAVLNWIYFTTQR